LAGYLHASLAGFLVYRELVMKKYQIVYAQNGGWCVIVSSKSSEADRFYGFRDEDHARDWIAKKLKKEQSADKLGVLAL
jgi:hypothetical protein